MKPTERSISIDSSGYRTVVATEAFVDAVKQKMGVVGRFEVNINRNHRKQYKRDDLDGIVVRIRLYVELP